jgi:hypothetical protein
MNDKTDNNKDDLASDSTVINKINSRQVIFHNKQQSRGSLKRDSELNGLIYTN